jgi:dTMP kinase
MIIILEGPDGCGKTTIADEIRKQSKDNLLATRCPGSEYSSVCKGLRLMMFDEKTSHRAQYHMIWADFYQMFDTVIIPALKLNKVVLLERFITSTYVYQYLLKNSMEKYSVISDMVDFKNRYLEFWNQIFYFYLEVNPEEMSRRINERKNTDDPSGFDKWSSENSRRMIQYYEEALVILKSHLHINSYRIDTTNRTIKQIVKEIYYVANRVNLYE